MTQSLWEFSLGLYNSPGVAPVCLALQDGHGADVNLVLFALWAARCGGRVGPAEAAMAEQMTRPWQAAVVEPLRSVRRALKLSAEPCDHDGAAALRDVIKAAELRAEHLQQDALATIVLPASDQPARALARDNLAAYAARLALPPAPAHLDVLLQAFATLHGAETGRA